MHYFEFHFQKIIAATKGWKDDEFGAYVRLLIEQFDRGFVPDDAAEVSRLITTYKKNWPLLKKKFTEPSEPGQLRNTFMVNIRDQAHEKSAINSENGKKGAKVKKQKQSERLANAKATDEQTHKRGLSQPVTSNQEPVNTDPEESRSVNDALHDLSKSNLFRQPKIPSIPQVVEAFVRNGGTAEMAQKFFDTNAATGWFYRGSPITNFANLVPGYISNWNRNDSGTPGSEVKKMVV